MIKFRHLEFLEIRSIRITNITEPLRYGHSIFPLFNVQKLCDLRGHSFRGVTKIFVSGEHAIVRKVLKGN